MKPVIGVMPLWDDEKESQWMLPAYFDKIIEAEFRSDESSRRIFRGFVQACGRFMAKRV